MSQKGPFLTVKKTPMYEIREDAAIILEEFLKKHIAENDFRNSAVTVRNKSDPLSERTKVHVGHKKNGVPRSKTMPSKSSKEEVPQKKNSENHLNNNGVPRSKTMPVENDPPEVNEKKLNDSESPFDKNVHIHRKSTENGFESSADSDGDPDEVLSNRKKKSAFKKAKQRLWHWFHLNTRDKTDGLMTGSERNSPAVTKKIKKKHSLDGHSHRADSKTSTLDTVHIQGQVDVDSQKNARKASFFGSIRKPQKIKASVVSESKPEITRDELKKSRSNGTPVSFQATGAAELVGPGLPNFSSDNSSHLTQPPYLAALGSESVAQILPDLPSNNSHHLPSPPPPATTSAKPVARVLSNLSSDNSHYLPPSPPPPGQASFVSKSSSPSPLNIGSIQAANSSSSSNFPASDYTKEGSNTNILSSIQSNALDSPGEDIDYIDLDDSVSQTSSRRFDVVGMRSPKMFEKLLGLKELAQTMGREVASMEGMVDGISFSKITLTSGFDLLDKIGDDDLDGRQKSAKVQLHSNKDELYGKIAKRLAEIADSYSTSMSDPESRGAAAVLTAPPTELEKDIIDCLRSIGDRNSTAVEEIRVEATEQAYHRFKSTIQNSMGSELSWDHLAFVFYTTKGVISAVGKGTKAASKAKEFTLDYISDTFASWIMDQGGFDSIVHSSSDSDFELD